MKEKKRRNLLGIPIMTWMGFLVGVPLVFVFVISFLSRDSLGNIEFKLTLENYQRILDPIYLRVFLNSFVLAMLTSLVTLIIGYPVAYFIAGLSEKGKSTAMLLLIIPFWTSSLLRTYGWIILLSNTGVINNVMMKLGIISAPLPMMYKFGTVLVGTAYMLIPFMIISIYNSVDKLDRSLLEASYDLGAGKIETFINITLPLTLPGIAGGVTLVLIPSLGLFFISDLLGGGQTVFLGNLINNQVTKGRNRPMAAALSVLMILIVLLVLLIYRRVTKNQKGGLFG